MALYDYRCSQCAHAFSVRKPMVKSAEAEVCPVCTAPSDKQVSRTSFLLKGGGWYKDGYASPRPS